MEREKAQQWKIPRIHRNQEQKQPRTIHRNNLKNIEEHKNIYKIKEILNTTKVIKSHEQHNNLKRILTSSTVRENTTQVVTKCKNERRGVYCKISKDNSVPLNPPKKNSEIIKI